ncbi:LysR family transcriptional regulator [Pontivivens insulae]|uniref:HTH-type transcriptional regulator PgrR n=1 Tax=Pontivivens insulae TaxID=1639689 RepID=A0A2R8A6X3_9RHOB|nr:LysR family transcriptional regulator [Pontivivens insulae]RED18094.1 DNA-binding transcriptional LysR family regulator [Pontivivens insulae]SPF27991.1 HTH-type transcriptional regulator PgrR [Pontivivens insulae]
MIDTYRNLAVFVAVADSGSFSAAARRLSLSTSVVSHHVTRLEERLETPLLFRSTRALTLTAEGERVLGSARRMVAAGEDAIDALADTSDQLVGSLKISLPAFGDQGPVHQAIWSFAKAHPLVAMSIHSTDRQVDLIRDGYDLAIRLGVLTDSALKAKRIAWFERKLVASPDALTRWGRIASLDDLSRGEFIHFSMVPQKFALTDGREEIIVTPERIRLEVSSISAGRQAALAGLGMLNLPASEIEADLATGRLVEVLPRWQPPTLGVYAVWPETGARKRLTQRLVEVLSP